MCGCVDVDAERVIVCGDDCYMGSKLGVLYDSGTNVYLSECRARQGSPSNV